ncbi:hypothetical protein HU200_060027 [Digitaria exilis]|uniref:Uncharacterized protein n=1 Tax=Digitaria exilis TaxID=1010633 RepID=A0A835AK33_9POAL|nr:hypothetical protein HU200_060027 [Digitaria exilis]
MEPQRTVRMNPGEGEASYARNSTFQIRMKPMIEEAVTELCCDSTNLPKSMMIADLGCSCGPSALTLISVAVDAIHRRCLQLQQAPPELGLLLNDLPSNDFNTAVKHLVAFQQKQNVDKSERGSSPGARDGSWGKNGNFLDRNTIPSSCFGIYPTNMGVRGPILDNMVSRGVLDQERLKTFYIPLYAPYEKEVKEIIEEQGSFSINKLQVHDSMAGVNKALISPKMIAYGLRAGIEPIIVDHFGLSGEIMDEFIRTAEQHMSPEFLEKELVKNPRIFLAISLARKS